MEHWTWEKIIITIIITIIVILQRIDQEDSMLTDVTEIVIREHCFLMIWGYILHWQWYDLMDE